MASTSIDSSFEDLLSAFTAAGVRFLVVGGYAVSSHGHPRSTKDLDLWIDATRDNARRAWRALAAFGMPLAGITAEDLATPGPWLQFGRPPKRVDILTRIESLTFSQAWESRVLRRFGAVEVPVLSIEDLIRNKRAVGRKQDLADAERLEQIRRDRQRGGEGRVSEGSAPTGRAAPRTRAPVVARRRKR